MAAVSHLSAAASKLDFGRIRLGNKATRFIQVANTGNTQITLTAVTGLSGPFTAALPATVRLPISPGSDLLLPASFAPIKRGNFTSRYVLHWTDVNGLHALIVTVSGTGGRREHEDRPED
jgi:hypothetical protein